MLCCTYPYPCIHEAWCFFVCLFVLRGKKDMLSVLWKPSIGSAWSPSSSSHVSLAAHLHISLHLPLSGTLSACSLGTWHFLDTLNHFVSSAASPVAELRGWKLFMGCLPFLPWSHAPSSCLQGYRGYSPLTYHCQEDLCQLILVAL